MQKWEYLRLDVHYKPGNEQGVQSVAANYGEILSNITFRDLHDHINKLGSEGWEMVSERSSSGRNHHVYYFKRPAAAEPNEARDAEASSAAGSLIELMQKPKGSED